MTYRSEIGDDNGRNSAYHEYSAKKEAIDLIKQNAAGIGHDTETQLPVIDTLLQRINGRADTDDVLMQLDLFRDSTVMLSAEDIYDTPLDSLFRKHGLHSFWQRLFTQQFVRLQRDPLKALQSIITNTSWMLLLLMPVLAAWLKVLYLRRKRYFVQHLILLFHYHATVFLVMSLYVLLLQILPVWLLVAVPVLCCAFLYLTMKNFYDQGWIKTFVKFILLMMGYALVLSVSFLITILVSVLILH